MRTTTDVIHDHLMRRLEGDLEGDIEHNYADDVLLLTSFSTFRGHDGVRQSAELLQQVGEQRGIFNYKRTVIEGPYAFLEWNAVHEGEETIRDGADSFHILDGRIVMQSIHFTAVVAPECGEQLA